MEKNSNYKTRLKAINTFVFDVDGVLTDGKIILEGSGEITRIMNIRDSLTIRRALEKNYNVCIITYGSSMMVKKRMNYLGVNDVFSSVDNKLDTLHSYCNTNKISLENVLYMGDDIPDLSCIKVSGIGTCPNDAVPEIRNVADYISHINGGDGCVRDVMEQVLKINDDWF